MSANAPKLEFVWIELTNRCNLQCGHCYAGSGPHAGDSDTMTAADYESVLSKAYDTGCRSVQFIGGEPTLNRDLPRLIERARGLGYELIEVYTNLYSIGAKLWQVFAESGVRLATSFYSAKPDAFDRATTRKGSFEKVVANIGTALAKGLPLRVGVIVSEETKADLEETTAFLRGLGVSEINVDNVREFGRAATSERGDMKQLCGNCAGNILVVGPDGVVAPCIMSKAWSVGNLHHEAFDDILAGRSLADTRTRIREATRERVGAGGEATACQPNDCQPFFNCSPNTQCSPCAPNGGHKCQPNYNCNPGQ